MKSGLRRQFRKILNHPNVSYFGNIKLGDQADISIDELQELGFSAVLVTVGAQKAKSLKLPGEDLEGVYHAKEIVSHFNLLPPYSTQSYPLGNSTAIIGVGNVMVDVTNLAVHSAGVKEITAVARRSVADVKFSKKEFSSIYPYMKNSLFSEEIKRITPRMKTAGQSVEDACTFIHSAYSSTEPKNPDTLFRFRFLSQPVEIVGKDGKVTGLLMEDTIMKPGAGGKRISVVGTGHKTLLECDSVVFCIGNDHDPKLGLPLNKWMEYAAAPNPRFPVDGISYESYDPTTDKTLDGVFIAGWAREPNKGLVGNSRKDGDNAACSIAKYLGTLSINEQNDPIEALSKKLDNLDKPYINHHDLMKLESIESDIAEQKYLAYFKFSTNEEMLAAINQKDYQNKKLTHDKLLILN